MVFLGLCLLVVLACWVLAARSAWLSWLCSPQSALLAELFLEEGDGPMSLQSHRTSGSRLSGRPSRRSLPSSQKSKKSISSQVWGGKCVLGSDNQGWGSPKGGPLCVLAWGTPQALGCSFWP